MCSVRSNTFIKGAETVVPLNAFQIMVQAAAPGDLDCWTRWVETRIRHLVRELEKHCTVRLHPRAFSHPSECARCFYIGLSRKITVAPYCEPVNGRIVQRQVQKTGRVNIRYIVHEFVNVLYNWHQRVKTMTVSPKVLRQHEIPGWLLQTNKRAASSDTCETSAKRVKES